MVATIDELMPLLRPMHEFDATAARAGGEDELKMALINAFYGALMSGGVESGLNLLKWMAGFNLAMTAAIVVKLFAV